MMTLTADGLAILLGGLIGLCYGVIGAGGSILAVPLLVYLLGMEPHLAIGTDTVAATLSALWTLVGHARAGAVRWAAATVYTLASVTGAAAGAHLGTALDGHALLAALGALMVVAAAMMLRPRPAGDDAWTRLGAAGARRLLVPGLGVGALAGLVGVGGGFLTVPALVLITDMPVLNAVASSLVSVTAVAATTAATYAVSGLVDWPVAGLLLLGGIIGGYLGVRSAEALAQRKRALTLLFSAVVALMGVYVTIKGLGRML